MAIPSTIAVGVALTDEPAELAGRVRTGVVQVGTARAAAEHLEQHGLMSPTITSPGDGARGLWPIAAPAATVIASLPSAIWRSSSRPKGPASRPGIWRAADRRGRHGRRASARRDAVSLAFSGVGPIEGRGNNRHMAEALLANIDLRPAIPAARW
jgi:hypothetical protein